MKGYPIAVMNLEMAKEAQFRLVDEIHREFTEDEFFQMGDVGLARPHQFPTYTEKVEKVLAAYFNTESALLVRGAGTGAIRAVLNARVSSGDKILVHDAPIYPTSLDIMESMGLEPVYYDYHDAQDITKEELEGISFALVQHSRQRPEDRYDLSQVIDFLKKVKPELEILTDDNYVVFKSEKIGCQLGAEVSAFSLFKLLGPEGIGCLAGKREVLDSVRKKMYSGGSKVQGHEAMEALRAMVYAPVAFAIQAEVADKIVEELNSGETGVKQAYIVNAQSRVILVELERPIAKKVLEESRKLGAASYPVGSESKYEVPALFYRISGTFRAAYPEMEETTIRINPMRAGQDTVLRILREAIAKASR
ncbi:aminotransferase class V-fold PLP-dependent enzyme [Clostridiales bacterium COT073_COT-073]|nr:aminotransferase class V-fold PLP-dependent enzyme [Clostridiales bacterium COT073_COT-073]